MDAKLHYHDNRIEIEHFEGLTSKDHSCIAIMNTENETPLLNIYKEQICRRWNTFDMMVKVLRQCRKQFDTSCTFEQEANIMQMMIDDVLFYVGGRDGSDS